jgi:basic membrane lipoprotein Med (substrate-binding protein (PBP1-ABC) superfamily)
LADTPQAAYNAARKLGKKFVSDNEQSEGRGYLPVLDDKLGSVELVGEISLGVHEIPLNKIAGTRTEGRSNAFAGNFMPLLEPNTEFGIKWCKLYESHISEGIREPIKVYEYINRYYVQEGNKRVSVLNYCDAATVPASVTRILPKRDESNKEISILYEFLDFDRRAVFDDMWFSWRGAFTQLVHFAEGYKKHTPENTQTLEELIRSVYTSFKFAYNRAKPEGVDILTGDALMEYTRIFGFPAEHTASQISTNVKMAESQFEQMISGQSHITDENNDVERAGGGLGGFLKRTRSSVRAAFVFDGTPEELPSTHLHEVGVRRLEFKYGDKLMVDRLYNASHKPDELYKQMSELVKNKPDVIFTTSPYMSNISLRIALENPEIVVLNCDRAREHNNLSTYYPKIHDALFLCGVVAGAMSKTDKIGYMTSSSFKKSVTCDVNAFAIGATIVNPRAKVINCRLQAPDDFEEQNAACRKFHDMGADVALVQQSFTNPLSQKSFPGVFAQLYLLHPELGYPDEAIGLASCDWAVFYDRVITDIMKNELTIKGSRPGDAIHFGWGLNTHLVDVYGVDAFMGHNATRLLGIFRALLDSGRVHPFTGPVYDREGDVRIEPYHTPTLAEIQSMNWLVESVVEMT